MFVLPYIRALFIFNEIECGENVGAVFADGDGVLEVGGGLAVFGAAGPTVFLGELDILGSHTDHGFYGYDHAFFEQGAGAGDSIVGDVGAFVHFEAYTMAAELTDDGVAVFLTVLLDGVSDVAHTVAFFAFLKPNIKCLLGDLKKPLHLGPETEERRIADGTFDTTYVPWSKSMCKTVVAQNQNRLLAVYSYEDGNWDSQFQYKRLPFFSVQDMVPLDETVPLPEGLSVSDAEARVRELFDAVDESFTISEVYRVGDSMDKSKDNSLKTDVHYALCFDCVRMVNGVSLALYTSDMGSTDEQSYSIPWTQEKLRIAVDADGIVSVDWIGPLTISDTIFDTTLLMSFEKIRGIAEKMIPIVYNMNGMEETKSQDVDVRSVRLELIRVREQNNIQELKGLLVPAWVFYGTITAETEYEPILFREYGIGGGSPIYLGDTMILCINAIDGTIIDPMLGY